MTCAGNVTQTYGGFLHDSVYQFKIYQGEAISVSETNAYQILLLFQTYPNFR